MLGVPAGKLYALESAARWSASNIPLREPWSSGEELTDESDNFGLLRPTTG
jgi:hypothetical protein